MDDLGFDVFRDESKEIWSKYEPGFGLLTGPLVSLLIVSYKNEKFNEKLFSSINSQTYKNIETIFVDNASPDDTVKTAKNFIGNGKLIVSGTNLGLPGGINLAAAYARGKYVCIVGPDVWMNTDSVQLIVAEAKKIEDAIYVPTQLNYEGTGFISRGIATDIFGYPARAYSLDGVKQIRTIFSADNGIFLTRENFVKLGMLDEDHFLFQEDIDLSWKAHLLGLPVLPVSRSVIYHYSGGSVGIGGYPKDSKYTTNSYRRFLAEKNVMRNIIKNYRWWNIAWVLPYYIIINLMEMVVLTLSGQFNIIYPAYIKAYLWNIRNIKSTLRKRKHIQSIRTVGDLEVMKLMSKIPSKFYALLELGVPKINK